MNGIDSLIDSLADDGASPMESHRLRFVWPLLAAFALCAVGAASVFDNAFGTVARDGLGPIAVKWGFSLALVLMAPIALWILGKPGRPSGWSVAFLAVPFVLMLALFAVDLSARGATGFPGTTWRNCLAAMTVMSPLAFGGAVYAMRALAPTHLGRAGLVAGLFGGGVAMTAYSPFCPESGMLYVMVFYLLPITVMASLGWLLGPRLLRW